MRREFSSRDLALFGAISAQLAISVENARLHADSLEKVREWTLQGAASQVRSIVVDPEGGVLFGGTLAKSAEATEWSESFTAHKAAVPPAPREQNTFVIRECIPE